MFKVPPSPGGDKITLQVQESEGQKDKNIVQGRLSFIDVLTQEGFLLWPYLRYKTIKQLHEKRVYFPKKKHFILLYLQYGRHENPLESLKYSKTHDMIMDTDNNTNTSIIFV